MNINEEDRRNKTTFYTASPEDDRWKRRGHVLWSFGPPGTDNNPGRFFFQDQNPPVVLRNPDTFFIATWARALAYITDKPSIPALTASINAKDQAEKRKQLSDIKEKTKKRFLQIAALRHNITLTDTDPLDEKTLNRLLTQTLPPRMDMLKTISFENGTEYMVKNRLHPFLLPVPAREMPSEELYQRVQKAIKDAHKVSDYIENPQSGLLKHMTNVLSGRINEIPGITTPEDLILLSLSDKWVKRAQFEAARTLGLADLALEKGFVEEKVSELKERVLKILDHRVFGEDKHGPLYTLNVLSHHDSKNFSVEWTKILKPKEHYSPTPYHLYSKFPMRVVTSKDKEPFLVHIKDDPKGDEATILKMVRNNEIDVRNIHDLYRLSIMVPDRKNIDQFLEEFKKGAIQDNEELELEPEENTLDGGEYSATHAGSSKHYKVMRLRIHDKKNPDIGIELSIYTLDAWLDYFNDERYAIGIYVLSRQFRKKKEEVDASVLEYLYPYDIYGVHFSDHLDYLVHTEKNTIRAKSFSANEFQDHHPVRIASEDIGACENAILKQIIDRELEFDEIICIGNNTVEAAHMIASKLGLHPPMIYDKKNETLDVFFERNRIEKSGKRYLIIDDIGVKGKTISELKNAIESMSPESSATLSFLITKEGFELPEGSILGGITIGKNEYAFFPNQLHEYPTQPTAVFNLIYRIRNNKIEVMVHQEKEDGRYRLPGGTFDASMDESIREASNREIAEEYGKEFIRTVNEGWIHQEPIEVQTKWRKNLPDSPSNLMKIVGYPADGNNLNIDQIQPPPTSPINRGTISFRELNQELVDQFDMKGFKELLFKFKERWQSDPESLFNSNLENI